MATLHLNTFRPMLIEEGASPIDEPIITPGVSFTPAPVRMAQADLRDHSFEGATLTNVDFTGADLRGANLSDAVFRHCIFWETDLTDVCLDSARFETCVFDYARFDGAIFDDARFDYCSFAGVSILAADLARVQFGAGNGFVCDRGDRLPFDAPPIFIRTPWRCGAILAQRLIICDTTQGCNLTEWIGQTEAMSILKDMFSKEKQKNEKN